MTSPTCEHSIENLVRHVGTTGYVDVDMIYCESCENYLYGSFSNYSDDCYLPSVKYDEAWFEMSGEVRLSDSLPEIVVAYEEIASGRISKLIPEYVSFGK